MKNSHNQSNTNDKNFINKLGLNVSSASFIPKNIINETHENKQFYLNWTNNIKVLPPFYDNTCLEKNKFDYVIQNNNQNQKSILYENDTNLTLLNENKPIKISLETNVKNMITSIVDYLNNQQNHTVYLTGLNTAISKVILIAEIVKIKIRNLHQINDLDCLISNNTYKLNKNPDENDIKMIPKFEIILTKIEPVLKGSGYQKPLTDEEIERLRDCYLEKTTQNIKEKLLKRDNFLAKRISRLKLVSRKKRRRILRKNDKVKRSYKNY